MLNSKLECRCSTVDVEQINSRFDLACYYYPVSWNTVAGYVSCTHQIKLPNCFHNGTLYISYIQSNVYTLFFCFLFLSLSFFLLFCFCFFAYFSSKKVASCSATNQLGRRKRQMEYTVNTFAEPNNLKSNKRIASY